MLKTKKKELLKILILIFVFIFAVSCNNIFNFGNKNKTNSKSKEKQENEEKKQKEQINEEYTGITVPLDAVNFSIENELLYYNKQLFTGRVTFTTNEGYSGYFTFSNGVMEGVYELKRNGNVEIGKTAGNKAIYVKTKSNSGYENEIIYDENNGLIKEVNYVDGEYEDNFDFSNKFSGKIKKFGKIYNFSESTKKIKDGLNDETETESENNNKNEIIVDKKDEIFIYNYSLREDDDYIIITERQYKGDKKNYRYLVFMGEKEEIFPRFGKDMLKVFKSIFTDIQGASNAQINTSTNANNEITQETATNYQSTPTSTSAPSQNNNTSNNQSSDEDLATLDRVYDEVINKGNESYLNNFSSSQLSIIRNTIYAKRGYIFKKEKYKNYFSRKSWYKGTSYSENIITPNEKKLAELILSKE